MGKDSSAPSAPDPYTTAAAQYQYGTEAADYNAALNRVNSTTPTGSTQYTITGTDPTTGAPIYSQNTSLSAPQQKILNATQTQELGQLGSAGSALGSVNSALGSTPSVKPVQSSVSANPVNTNLNTSNVPGIANVGSLEQQGQSTALAGEEAAIMPGMKQQQEQLDSSLRNSGAVPGDPAYDNAMASFNASMNNAQTQAAGAAITAGTGLQSTNYGESANTNSQLFGEDTSALSAENAAQGQQYSQGLSSAQLNNTAGSQELSNWAQELGIPLSAITSLMGAGGGVGSSGSGTGSSTAAGASTSAPDIMAAFQNQYQGQLAGYNANVATDNADTGAGATLGAAAIAALGSSF